MGFVGTMTRAFMHGPNWQDAHGLDGFLELLDKRADIDGRTRGLITGMHHQDVEMAMILTNGLSVSNHICVYVRTTKSKHHAPQPVQQLTNVNP